MKTTMNVIGRMLVLLVIPALFCCSAGLMTVKQHAPAAESIRELPILKGPADYFTIGRAFHKDGEYRIALDYFLKAVELAPMDARYRLFSGLAKNEVYGYEASEPDMDMALALKQDLIGYEGIIRNYYKNYGVYCMNSDDMKKSIECFNKVVALLPNDGEVRQYLAAVYLDLARECSNDKMCSLQHTDKLYGKVFTTLLD